MQDSPLHDGYGFNHPIHVAPDGSVVVLGSGMIHDATTLARSPLSLANSIVDAAWLGETLYTVRHIAGLSQFQRWGRPTYELERVVQKSGTTLALVALDEDRLLAVTLEGGGIPVLTLLDENLNVSSFGLSAASMAENLPAGTPVGTLAANSGEACSYALVSGSGDTGNAAFAIAGNQLQTAAVLDFETQSSYSIRIRATDMNGFSSDQVFRVTVTNANDRPTAITLYDATVLENVAGAHIGSLEVSDPEPADTHQCTVDDARFEVAGGWLKLRDDVSLTRDEVLSTITVNLTAADNGTPPQALTVPFAITVAANPRPWRNPVNVLDVNLDGFVAPRDVLVIVNQLNSRALLDAQGRLPAVRPVMPAVYYYDVNGDGFATPLDALSIVNHLNGVSTRDGAAAEGALSSLATWDARQADAAATPGEAARNLRSDPDCERGCRRQPEDRRHASVMSSEHDVPAAVMPRRRAASTAEPDAAGFESALQQIAGDIAALRGSNWRSRPANLSSVANGRSRT